MGELIDEHKKMQKLVETGVLIPGVYSGNVGSIVYEPISVEEYLHRVKLGNVWGLSYNTRTMGRGIFTLGNEGRIVNFKGVDSHLENSKSIAVSKTEGALEAITNQDSYGINAIHFTDRSTEHPEGIERIEFRIKGASQLQNLLSEKIKRDLIEQKDEQHIVKLPSLDLPTGFTEEFCERFDLPSAVPITDDFVSGLEEGSFGKYCYDYLQQIGRTPSTRNQLWTEYFSQREPQRLQDNAFRTVIEREDSTYGLGAIFGQTTRKLDNPFRIMELEYYIKMNDTEAVRAIMDYSMERCGGDLLSQYSEISAKNAAGFMNLNLTFINFEHRQDFPLSGEICDDAYDDVSESLHASIPSDNDKYRQLQYYNQVYIWITNMKIIEDAYKLIGREVPDGYKQVFVEKFYEFLKDKQKFKMCFEEPDPIGVLSQRVNNAGKNFSGMDEFVQDFRELAIDLYKSKIPQAQSPRISNDKDGR